MEKQDLKLQALLDADVPNEGQVEAQVDQVLAARGKLEREFTLMNLDLRKVLSLDQWRQLKAVRGADGGDGRQGFLPEGSSARRDAFDCTSAAGRALASASPSSRRPDVLISVAPASRPASRAGRMPPDQPAGCRRYENLLGNTGGVFFVLDFLVSLTSKETAMKFGVIIFPGSNCDHDAFWTIQNVAKQPVTFLWHESHDLENCDAIIVPGGFAYGDYLRTGAIAKFSPVMESVRKFADGGGLVLGICNGFQILCESGLLPGALMRNSGLKYVCKPVQVRVENAETPFTNACHKGEVLTIPIGHMEGNYFCDQATFAELQRNQQIVFRYCSPGGRDYGRGQSQRIAG